MPAYLETEQELSRLARRAAGMRGGPRLLILPGMMGSSIGHLRKSGGADVTWFDPAEIAQGQLRSAICEVDEHAAAAGAIAGANGETIGELEISDLCSAIELEENCDLDSASLREDQRVAHAERFP